MSGDSLPWDQSPGYLAAIAAQVAPGGLTTYRVPRPVGASPTDVTGFMPGQAEWAANSYSDILYQLYPTKEWDDFKKRGRPLQKIDEDGNLMVEPFPESSSTPRPLLDLPILPNIIGTSESASYFETVRRWDTRIRWEDLTMRMPLSERPTNNTLQMRVARFLRGNYSLIAWHDTIPWDKPNASRDRVLQSLTDAQKKANTTRGSTPGLIDPSLGAAGGMVPYPVLRRGQGQNRKPRKNRANATTSTAAGQSQNKHRCAQKGRAGNDNIGGKDLERAREEDGPDGVIAMDQQACSDQNRHQDASYGNERPLTGQNLAISLGKRKRDDVGEFNGTGDRHGRPVKRMRRRSSSEEAIAQSSAYGIPLDPLLFADLDIVL